MIELKDTWDTVVMLLVAGGVGLLGGAGAGLLEVRRSPKASGGMFASSVFLGGIAAIAILYFFPPALETVKDVGGAPETTMEYDLTKLVALALIVGSAGANFLLVLQTRTLALAKSEQEAAANANASATASEALGGLGGQAPVLAKSGAEAAAPAVQEALEEAKSGGEVTPEMVAQVMGQIGDRAEKAVKESIDPAVKGAQKSVLAAWKAAPEETDAPEEEGEAEAG